MISQIDCLKGLKNLKKETIDLIYLDPPFFTQKTQKLTSKDGQKYSFEDKWDCLEDYISFLKERIVECKNVLKNTGSLFLHCDSKASHHIKIMLDSVFGKTNFRSEIIWSYKRWTNSHKGLIPNHETIFFYSKSNDYKFNVLLTEYSETTNIDQIQQERVRDSNGKVQYKTDENGNIVQAKAKNGVPLSDVWEIPFLNPKAKERTGYPTQKPIELLERIIKIASDEGDTVLDPFCGSGTTLIAAKLLNRKYIGFDISKEAIDLTNKRINEPFKTTSQLLAKGKSAYKTKTEEVEWVLKILGCTIVQRNKGIDGFYQENIDNKPVCLRIQRDGETIDEGVKLMKNAMQTKNCSYGIFIKSVNEKKDIKTENNIIIIDDLSKLIENLIDKAK